jgi:hypothetical protein
MKSIHFVRLPDYISQKSYQPRLNHYSRRQNRRSWFLYQFAHLKPRRHKIFGLCSQVNIVNQGDLQHHRWVLENIKGVNIALAETGNQAFDLDFGEQMFVVLNIILSA